MIILSQTSFWLFRTKTQFADTIKTVSDLGEQSLAFTEIEMGVLCAHQPLAQVGLKEIFGKEVSRDLLARLRYIDLIANGQGLRGSERRMPS